MPQAAVNRPVSRRDQVIAHAMTGALTDKTMARITGSTLKEVRRWRRQAGIKLMARRKLGADQYRRNYLTMLLSLSSVINRTVRLHSSLRLRATSRPNARVGAVSIEPPGSVSSHGSSGISIAGRLRSFRVS